MPEQQRGRRGRCREQQRRRAAGPRCLRPRGGGERDRARRFTGFLLELRQLREFLRSRRQHLTTQWTRPIPDGAWSGTSFASPIVAAVSALVLPIAPSLSNTQLISLLEQSVDDIGPVGYDTSFGYGRVNAFRAVGAAATWAGPSARRRPRFPSSALPVRRRTPSFTWEQPFPWRPPPPRPLPVPK